MPLPVKLIFDGLLIAMGGLGLAVGIRDVSTNPKALIAIATGSLLAASGIYLMVTDLR